jgi:hypothetical protein
MVNVVAGLFEQDTNQNNATDLIHRPQYDTAFRQGCIEVLQPFNLHVRSPVGTPGQTDINHHLLDESSRNAFEEFFHGQIARHPSREEPFHLLLHLPRPAPPQRHGKPCDCSSQR